MKKFNVEFWDSENQIWESYDELYNMECETAAEAIELAIDWCVENDIRRGDIDYDIILADYDNLFWRAAELVTDEDGYIVVGEWVVR